MNTYRLTAIAMAAVLAGFAHALAAEENIPTIAATDNFQQTATEQKLETENLVSEMDIPAQTASQPADNLLSEMKVYPSF